MFWDNIPVLVTFIKKFLLLQKLIWDKNQYRKCALSSYIRDLKQNCIIFMSFAKTLGISFHLGIRKGAIGGMFIWLVSRSSWSLHGSSVFIRMSFLIQNSPTPALYMFHRKPESSNSKFLCSHYFVTRKTDSAAWSYVSALYFSTSCTCLLCMLYVNHQSLFCSMLKKRSINPFVLVLCYHLLVFVTKYKRRIYWLEANFRFPVW